MGLGSGYVSAQVRITGSFRVEFRFGSVLASVWFQFRSLFGICFGIGHTGQRQPKTVNIGVATVIATGIFSSCSDNRFSFVIWIFPIFTRAIIQEIVYATNVSILDPFFPFTLWDATCIPIQNNFYA
ncbi:hypothetical protein HanIR_Chr14g0717381 [Helianthus annuus]|nr:hypothetical protein HanIR_Chr14g0717381 [Helianthus annuus]